MFISKKKVYFYLHLAGATLKGKYISRFTSIFRYSVFCFDKCFNIFLICNKVESF